MYQDFEADMERRHWESMKKGDKQSLAWLYDRYFKLLYNYGKKIGIGNSELEDAIQDLFVDLWRFKANLSSTTSVRFYLYRSLRRRVARNSSANTFFTSNEFDVQDVFAIVTPSSEQKIIDDEMQLQLIHRLKKLLNDLAPRQYEAMILRFYDELSFAEIAAILEVNEQSARNLVQRALFQLKQYAKHVIPVLFFFPF